MLGTNGYKMKMTMLKRPFFLDYLEQEGIRIPLSLLKKNLENTMFSRFFGFGNIGVYEKI